MVTDRRGNVVGKTRKIVGTTIWDRPQENAAGHVTKVFYIGP